jgi:hypothetical protein
MPPTGFHLRYARNILAVRRSASRELSLEPLSRLQVSIHTIGVPDYLTCRNVSNLNTRMGPIFSFSFYFLILP